MKRIALGCLLVTSLMMTGPTHAANVSYDGSSFMWPDSPGNGYFGLYIDDDISHSRLTSNLRSGSGTLCTGLSDTPCSNQTVKLRAYLPACTTSTQTDCIESVTAKSGDQPRDVGTFDRAFPSAGLTDFAGDQTARIPTGATPSLWNLANTPHNDGNAYLAAIAVSGTSVFSGTRQPLSEMQIYASLYPVTVKAGRFARNVAMPGIDGVSHPSLDKWGNCGALDEGYCAARQSFPADTRFGVTLRLSTAPTGWLHGRVYSPQVTYQTSGDVTRLSVDALPVEVPAIAMWKYVDDLPAELRTKYAGGCVSGAPCGQVNPQSSFATSAVDEWRSAYDDKASWVRRNWMFQTLSTESGAGSSNSCLSKSGEFLGVVTTNASGYEAGPPTFSPSAKTLSYKVASPHFSDSGTELKGTYDVIMKSSVARCLYGTSDVQITGDVKVAYGSTEDTPPIVSVKDDGTWFSVSAAGFHYSSPTIKTSLKAGVPNGGSTVPTMPTLSTTTTSTSVPAGGIVPVAATVPVVSRTPPALSPRKSVTGSAIAKYLGMTVPGGSRISVKVSASSTRVCRVSGSSVKGVRKGTCRVTVTVTSKAGKRTSKSVALKVAT